MIPEKIEKLRALAERGDPGEKDNAISILEKNGIDWKKPKENILNSVKKVVGINIIKTYQVDIKYSTDILLMEKLVSIFSRTKTSHKISISNIKIQFICTPIEKKEIEEYFFKNRGIFNNSMDLEANKHIAKMLE